MTSAGPLPSRHRRRSAFTLIELLVSTFLITVTLSAILGGYTGNIHLTDLATSRVSYQLQVNRFLEDLRRVSFDELWTRAGVPTQRLPLTGELPVFANPAGSIGELLIQYSRVTYGSNGQAVEVTVDPMWREARNRGGGEDANLNGLRDAGEDANGNGRLDSPYQLTIRIARRL